MNELTIINHDGILVSDSRDVASMVGKKHTNLLRDIDNYAGTIAASENSKLSSLDFFIPHTYTVPGQTREYPCYLLTKKGCEMVANKMIGEKGILFTAAYVTQFADMEKVIQAATRPQQTVFVVPETHAQIGEITREVKSVQARLYDMSRIVPIEPSGWRKTVERIITRIALARGGQQHQNAVRDEVFAQVENRFSIRLSVRMTNIKRIMARNGVSDSRISKVSRYDAVASDKTFIEGLLAVVLQMYVEQVLKAPEQLCLQDQRTLLPSSRR